MISHRTDDLLEDNSAISADCIGAPHPHHQLLLAGAMISLVFAILAGQLIRLGMQARATVFSSMATAASQGWARPNIVDRKGRLLATDTLMPSLYADPSLILDVDEIIETLRGVFPDLNYHRLHTQISDRKRRFVWLRRGMTPREAQQVHNLGLPGLAFRNERHRIYPSGRLASFVLGQVDIDNKGIAGIERYIDENIGIRPAHGDRQTLMTPVVLTLDLGVQYTLRSELASALQRYKAKGASGIVLDVNTGEILAAASLPLLEPPLLPTKRQNLTTNQLENQTPSQHSSAPQFDQSNPSAQTPQLVSRDRLQGGSYELGSVFKAMTIAMALDRGQATPLKLYDVTLGLKLGRKRLAAHGPRRPLSVTEIFLYSSNIGAAMLALEAGTVPQQEFLQRLGLLETIRTEAGPVARPTLPHNWGQAQTITISYGHGLAISPLQFAAAAAALINGGHKVQPTYLPTIPRDENSDRAAIDGINLTRVLSPVTSRQMREIMRLNVASRQGTGRRAAAHGYRVGGKTGTAEIPGPDGYAKKSVISSFLAAFPMDAPRYLTLISLFEPVGTAETRNQITASVNAAPTTARLIKRIAPLLGILPQLAK